MSFLFCFLFDVRSEGLFTAYYFMIQVCKKIQSDSPGLDLLESLITSDETKPSERLVFFFKIYDDVT